jgi:hypothetical protein
VVRMVMHAMMALGGDAGAGMTAVAAAGRIVVATRCHIERAAVCEVCAGSFGEEVRPERRIQNGVHVMRVG